MNVRNVIGLLLILLLGTAGCADGRRPGILSLAPPTASRATIEDLAAGKRDCLQYPIAKFADGSEDWNADWVFFTLVRSSDSQLVRNAKGEPLAAGLLLSQTTKFMKDHPAIPNTAWCYVVKRMKRHVRSGQVVSQSDYVMLGDVDLAEIVAKDRQARARSGPADGGS